MAKRILPADRVIAFFMTEPVPLAEQMLATARAILRERSPKPASQQTSRKRSRKPSLPKEAPAATTFDPLALAKERAS